MRLPHLEVGKVLHQQAVAVPRQAQKRRVCQILAMPVRVVAARRGAVGPAGKKRRTISHDPMDQNGGKSGSLDRVVRDGATSTGGRTISEMVTYRSEPVSGMGWIATSGTVQWLIIAFLLLR